MFRATIVAVGDLYKLSDALMSLNDRKVRTAPDYCITWKIQERLEVQEGSVVQVTNIVKEEQTWKP
jgi:hypothetical protein